MIGFLSHLFDDFLMISLSFFLLKKWTRWLQQLRRLHRRWWVTTTIPGWWTWWEIWISWDKHHLRHSMLWCLSEWTCRKWVNLKSLQFPSPWCSDTLIWWVSNRWETCLLLQTSKGSWVHMDQWQIKTIKMIHLEIKNWITTIPTINSLKSKVVKIDQTIQNLSLCSRTCSSFKGYLRYCRIPRFQSPKLILNLHFMSARKRSRRYSRD